MSVPYSVNKSGTAPAASMEHRKKGSAAYFYIKTGTMYPSRRDTVTSTIHTPTSSTDVDKNSA